MKKKEKRMIAILLTIMVIAIAILIIMRNKPKEEKKIETEKVVQQQEEKYVEKLEDGTKLNTSNKLKETKKIEGLEITNIQLTEKNEVTQLIGTIKNVTSTPQGGYQVEVTILDEEEKELITIEGYIEEIQPGEEKQFSTNGTFEYANAYDIKITKKQ